jgi:hypothetical protein
MKNRLLVILLFVALFAVTVGLGYQLQQLRSQVEALSVQIDGLRESSAALAELQQSGGVESPAVRDNGQERTTPNVRVIRDDGTSPIGVPWSVERAMLHEGNQFQQQNLQYFSPSQGEIKVIPDK